MSPETANATGQGIPVLFKKTPRGGRKKAVDTFKLASAGHAAGKCEVCLGSIQPGKRGQQKRLCSLKCRHLVWALKILTKALAAGEAEGLRAKARELVALLETAPLPVEDETRHILRE